MKFRKITSSLLGCTMAIAISVGVFAASESLNGGGATWSGGENEDNTLFSQVVDNKSDGVKYSVTVWVQSDDGVKSEKSGTTSGVGDSGKVYVSKGATHKKPFTPEKCGYKNFVAVKAN